MTILFTLEGDNHYLSRDAECTYDVIRVGILLCNPDVEFTNLCLSIILIFPF